MSCWSWHHWAKTAIDPIVDGRVVGTMGTVIVTVTFMAPWLLCKPRLRSASPACGVHPLHQYDPHHPHTDGQTENLHTTLHTTLHTVSRQFLSMLHASASEHHQGQEEVIPSFSNADHNTIHCATGFTSHELLFGCSPRDLCAPDLA